MLEKNHFVTAEADFDDSIKRERIRVSLNIQRNNMTQQTIFNRDFYRIYHSIGDLHAACIASGDLGTDVSLVGMNTILLIVCARSQFQQ